MRSPVEVGEIGLKTPGVSGAVQFTGMSVNGLVPSSSSALVFFALDDFEKRKSKNLTAKAIAATLNAEALCHQGRLHHRGPGSGDHGNGHSRRLQAQRGGPR